MILGRYEQQPSDLQDYILDFSPWLNTDEKVAGVSSISVSPTGLVINNITVTNDQEKVFFTVTGGDSEQRYTLEVTITTDAPIPRVKQDEMFITVRDL